VDDLSSANSSACSTTPIAYLRGQQNIFTASCQASSFLVHIRTDSTNDDMCSVQLEGKVVAFENASIHASFTLDKQQLVGSEPSNSTRSFVVSVVIIDAASGADSVPTETTSCRPLVSSFVLSVPPGMELPHQISICKVKATEADGKFLSFSIVAAGSLRSLDSYVIKVECSHLYFSVMDVAIGSMSDIDLSVVNTQQQQEEMRSMTMRIFKNSLVRAVTVSDRGVAAVTFDSKVVFLDIDDDNDEDEEDEEEEEDESSDS